MRACIHTCIHTYIHTYENNYIHAYLHTCIYTYNTYNTYIHTYIQILHTRFSATSLVHLSSLHLNPHDLSPHTHQTCTNHPVSSSQDIKDSFLVRSIAVCSLAGVGNPKPFFAGVRRLPICAVLTGWCVC